MSMVEILALTIIVLVVLVWRISWLVTRAGRNPGRELLQSAKLPAVIVQTVRN
jgi:hypothetical protein